MVHCLQPDAASGVLSLPLAIIIYTTHKLCPTVVAMGVVQVNPVMLTANTDLIAAPVHTFAARYRGASSRQRDSYPTSSVTRLA